MPKRPRKRSGDGGAEFVLRSGYVIPYDADDAVGMLNHLKSAILGESLERAAANEEKKWDTLTQEIAAEITHVMSTTPPDIARGLLIALLSAAVFERLRAMATEEEIQDIPDETETIQ
jgi:hypothetical protein